MKRMEVHLEKSHVGDTGALALGFGGTTIEISIAYTNNTEALSFGRFQVRVDDYENLLKALNKARKYVHNHDRKDQVMVPFHLEKED